MKLSQKYILKLNYTSEHLNRTFRNDRFQHYLNINYFKRLSGECIENWLCDYLEYLKQQLDAASENIGTWYYQKPSDITKVSSYVCENKLYGEANFRQNCQSSECKFLRKWLPTTDKAVIKNIHPFLPPLHKKWSFLLRVSSVNVTKFPKS